MQERGRYLGMVYSSLSTLITSSNQFQPLLRIVRSNVFTAGAERFNLMGTSFSEFHCGLLALQDSGGAQQILAFLVGTPSFPKEKKTSIPAAPGYK
jgi:hypothetical protein